MEFLLEFSLGATWKSWSVLIDKKISDLLKSEIFLYRKETRN